MNGRQNPTQELATSKRKKCESKEAQLQLGFSSNSEQEAKDLSGVGWFHFPPSLNASLLFVNGC